MRFKNYKDIFTQLIKYKSVPTKYPLVSMIISYDSTRAITVTKASEHESIIKMYCLKDYSIKFEEHVGGKEEQFIKIKEVEQNAAGNLFACTYMDDGKFRMRVFGKENRSEEEIEKTEVKISEML